jgi:hypothetical protein
VAITRVNSASLTGTGTSSPVTFTITAGTGIKAGDLLVAMGGSQGTHVTNGMTCKDSVNNVNFNVLLETDQGGSSSHWGQSFWYQTPQDIPDGSTITFTPYATPLVAGIALDVFRGCAGTISGAAVGLSNSTSATPPQPALGSAAPAGDLVIVTVTCSTGSTIASPGSPFVLGSSQNTNQCVGVGYILSAAGGSTYSGLTWNITSTNTSATQIASFTHSGTDTSPAWATAYDTTAVAGTGTWTNPANAEGTGGSGGPWATWTAP